MMFQLLNFSVYENWINDVRVAQAVSLIGFVCTHRIGLEMKLCKKETALYWFVHSVVWIGIALPTVFFLLRINHPTHEEVETKSIQYVYNDTVYAS